MAIDVYPAVSEIAAPKGARVRPMRGDADRVVGMLSNTKKTNELYLRRLAEHLGANGDRQMFREKANVSLPASDEIIDELAQKTDLVIVGIGN
jgi:hypothetical protein